MSEKISYIAPFGLRMPSDIRAWVERSADQIDRSMNYVIVAILRDRMKSSASVAATGSGLVTKSPAAAYDTAALAGSDIANPANGVP
ncbi:hypothetical protein CHELA1G11_12965 [Hyphomicrobiales bacterium]|nr:hypothetical protein CHELA1G11_12965 [Hyphomicrobiales bacterium]